MAKARFRFGSHELKPYLSSDELQKKWENQVQGFTNPEHTRPLPPASPSSSETESSGQETPKTEPKMLKK